MKLSFSNRFLSVFCLTTLILFCTPSESALPTNPVSDSQFLILPNGKDLRQLTASGAALSLSRGSGVKFDSKAKALYEKIRDESKRDPDYPVQWSLMDLDGHRILAESLGSTRKIFGASSSKIFVAATLMDFQNGVVSNSQLQLMSEMLVVSSNTAWVNLQSQIGKGNADLGRERNYNFTQRMGYPRTRGFQGTWGQMHGNELVASELVEFLHDTYFGEYPGAEYVWKLMHTCRTGASRGRKYLPTSLFVGGKTGTYDGPTTNPETGLTTNPNGSSYTVAVRNHVLIFNFQGRQYGLGILADTGSDESAAALAGGLLREVLGYKDISEEQTTAATEAAALP